jgi:hypothetical protein
LSFDFFAFLSLEESCLVELQLVEFAFQGFQIIIFSAGFEVVCFFVASALTCGFSRGELSSFPSQYFEGMPHMCSSVGVLQPGQVQARIQGL